MAAIATREEILGMADIRDSQDEMSISASM
jgi:hypothetical protein